MQNSKKYIRKNCCPYNAQSLLALTLVPHLSGHPNRAGVQMTLPHHGTAQNNQRCSAEAELICT